MAVRMQVPPRDAAFYANLDRRRGGWSKPGAHTWRLQEAMGIDEDTGAAILSRASELLSSRTRFIWNTTEAKTFRDEIGRRLEEDEQLGRYFQHSFSQDNYPEACQFFEEAATHWISLANYLKPEGLKRPSMLGRSALERESNIPKSENDGDLGFTALSSVSQRGEACRIRSKSQIGTIENALSRSNLPCQLQTPLADMDSPPHASIAHGAETKKRPFHSMIKIDSPTTRHFAAACMMDLFDTIDTPEPAQVNLDSVRSYWNQYRKSIGLSTLSNDEIQFKFAWNQANVPANEWNIFDDVSLRLAYRLWLSQGNNQNPFVLFLRDEGNE